MTLAKLSRLSKMNIFNKYKLALIGVVLGAVAGYFYYLYIGCNSGSCAITSQPVNSTAYGALMGGLLFSAFKKEKETKENEHGKDD